MICNAVSVKVKLFFLCGLFSIFHINLEANILAKPVGDPIVISPDNQTHVDPVLANFEKVMDNFFVPPYYPGDVPYLSDILYSTNFFLAGKLIINPLNDKIMHMAMGENLILDASNVFRFTNPSNTFATSRDGGLTWTYGPPIVQIIPLDGSISQLNNASLGPGLTYEYTKYGDIYASGNGFFDLRPNPPYTVPQTGFLFTRSKNEGKTWSEPNIVLRSDKDWWFQLVNSPYNNGLGPREFYLTPDPAHPKIIHASTTFIQQPEFFFGSTYYLNSHDGGRTFSQPREVYNLLNDPVWVKDNFDPQLNDPKNFTFGGLTIVSSKPVIYDENTILLPIMRRYPKRGSPVFAGTATFFTDQALVRSLDRGKTWEKVAGATDQYLARASNVYDPGYVNPNLTRNISGIPRGGFFDEGCLSCAPGLQLSTPVVSPFTGRIYLTYEANNPTFGLPTPQLTANYILVSASSDKGKTFSHSVQINRTPTDIVMGAQQAFSHNTIMTKDGCLVVAYYDFRNWSGGILPLPPFVNTVDNMPPLEVDGWIAIYKEVDDPQGGSTGLGLDFVEEIRLTSESFNYRVTLFVPFIPYVTSTPETIPLAVNSQNMLHVVYSVPFSSRIPVQEGYKGAALNLNSYYKLFLQRFQFPLPSNQ